MVIANKIFRVSNAFSVTFDQGNTKEWARNDFPILPPIFRSSLHVLPSQSSKENHSSCTFVQLERTNTNPIWALNQKVITCSFLPGKIHE